MTGCVLHDQLSSLLRVMRGADSHTFSRESLAWLLERHAAENCCTGLAEPPKSTVGSSMGYTTAEIAEILDVSPATAGRYIRGGWFGDPAGLRPNGAHYRVPRPVAEDVFRNGPLCDREPGDDESESRVVDPTEGRSEGPPSKQKGTVEVAAVPPESQAPTSRAEGESRRASAGPAREGAWSAEDRSSAALGAKGVGSLDHEGTAADAGAAPVVESSAQGDPLDLLGDWKDLW